MRQLGWPGFAAALFVIPATVASAPVTEPASAGSAVRGDIPPVAFNPPFDRDLSLTISDRRQLPNGDEIFFTVQNRLRFTRGQGGMIATIRRDSIDCTGPARLCATYRQAMAGWMGTVQRYAIAADGRISTLVDNDVLLAGDGLPEARAILAHIEQQRPGALGMAELREALSYVGQPLDSTTLDAPGRDSPDEIVVTMLPGQLAEITYSSRIRLESDPTVAIVREQRDRVDLTTGLVLESVATSRDAALAPGANAPVLSDRRWRIDL